MKDIKTKVKKRSLLPLAYEHLCRIYADMKRKPQGYYKENGFVFYKYDDVGALMDA